MTHPYKIIYITLMLLAYSASNWSADLRTIENTNIQKIKQAKQSQEHIDKIAGQMQDDLATYNSLLKQIDGLKIYNDQLSIQIERQQDLLNRYDNSIAQTTIIERQILPLLSKMVQSLEDFIALDMPFHLVERRERIAFIKENLIAADISIAEKFRQIMEAYEIENEYGRTIDSYEDIVILNNIQQEVNILRVGRIALLCQTKNTRISGRFDTQQKSWLILDAKIYRNTIRQGIRMAKKQASLDMLYLPIVTP